MKTLILFPVLLIFALSTVSFGLPLDRFSLKDFKNALKDDASASNNSELANQVLQEGVSFEYTAKREQSLRDWGATDQLIAAIWQSIVDENDEGRMYGEFMKLYDSGDKEIRKTALEKGNAYLTRFESNTRFGKNVERVKKEIRFLACEFDPSLGC